MYFIKTAVFTIASHQINLFYKKIIREIVTRVWDDEKLILSKTMRKKNVSTFCHEFLVKRV